LQALAPVTYLEGEQYNLALNATKIALSFLSTLNRDTYTRRSFEIPAAGAFMLSQYTPDLATLFEEGREVEFFRTPAELVLKAKYYLEHDHERREIAQRGLERVRRDCHDIVSRMREMITTIVDLQPAIVASRICA
jgi:spore maturation protein CgeB